MKKMILAIIMVVTMPSLYAMKGPTLQPKPTVSSSLPAEQRKSKQALPRFKAVDKTPVAKNNIQQQQHTHPHKEPLKCHCVIV